MRLSRKELKKTISNKTDNELYDILHVHSRDYSPEAIEVARDEFLVRKVDTPTLESLGSAGEAMRTREEAPLEWSLRIIAFFFSTAFLGIPVLLAYRHYIEHGSRRKAREWGRWGLFGFAFYLALSIITYIQKGIQPHL